MVLRLLRRVVLWIVVTGFSWLFFSIVWPTRYRYDHVLTEDETYPVRIDRFTGDADMLTPDGWVPMQSEDGGDSTGDKSSAS